MDLVVRVVLDLEVVAVIAAAELAVQITRAALKPTISLSAGYSEKNVFDSPNFTHAGSIGLDISGPIYAGGKVAALLRQSIANNEAARANPQPEATP